MKLIDPPVNPARAGLGLCFWTGLAEGAISVEQNEGDFGQRGGIAANLKAHP
ncbi:hypothetical protein JJJ17_13835 [Paracoccus caeni]|uniref:Uncharacterized protein n=1 Tax=Paracoccus caeni TaxID=657651 RepID=A0A934SG39_9RHOB|nr:hypothetical protein [Paracoccus caeni]MBK4217013.1 hypothetical protein [Paracoccus caeni]